MTERTAHDASNDAVVRDSARAGDLDRYLAALLAPRRARQDLLALTAFLGEVARIPTAVREPMMGEIRLQWWRDALASARVGSATGSPIADALGRTMVRHNLPMELLLAPIDARSRDLNATPREEALLPEVADYVGATEGAAFRLSARVLGIDETPAVADLLGAAAQAYGRVRLACSLGQTGDSRGAELSQGARVWLAEARRLAAAAPPAVLPAILPVALVEPYLAALEGAGPEITGERADISPLTRVWRLWWAKARRHI